MDGSGRAAGGRLAIVADDLTGAADAGAPFADAGIAAAVALRPGVDPGTAVVAVSTESRDLPETAAIAAVRQSADWLAAEMCPRWWYKKVDSMWRGYPEAESLALAAAVGLARVVLAPALPERARFVRSGVIFVGDDAVADPRAATSLRLRRLRLSDVRSGSSALATAIRSLPGGAAVADGESEADLRALAEAALTTGCALLGGSAGLAAHLAAVLPLPRTGRLPEPAAGPALAVVASRHPAAAAQVLEAATAGIAVVVRAPTDSSLVEPATHDRLAGVVADALARRRSVVLTTAGGEQSGTPGRDLARGLAAVAAHPEVSGRAAAFYLSGGDAAAACLDALAAETLLLGGDVEPGIPWGAIGGGIAAGTPVVTKAGSFGDSGTLSRCLAFLAGAPRPGV